MKTFSISILTFLILFSCKHNQASIYTEQDPEIPMAFDTSRLKINSGGVDVVRGQVLYVPIYSNLPLKEAHKSHHGKIDMSAVLVIHNTDFSHTINISNVLFFNNDGKLVKDYLSNPIKLRPLASNNFYIPIKDTSGAGANFIVEWTSIMPVTKPIVESVMLDALNAQGLSFISEGRILREIR